MDEGMGREIQHLPVLLGQLNGWKVFSPCVCTQSVIDGRSSPAKNRRSNRRPKVPKPKNRRLNRSRRSKFDRRPNRSRTEADPSVDHCTQYNQLLTNPARSIAHQAHAFEILSTRFLPISDLVESGFFQGPQKEAEEYEGLL